MLHKMKWLILFVLLLGIVGCSPAGAEPGVEPIDDGAQQVAAEALPAARQALADYLGVDSGSLELEKIEDAEWSDSCLGLGGPAEICAAVITPGYAITFTVDGQSLTVRTDLDGEQVRIADESAGAPAGEIPGPDLNGAVVFFQRSGGLAGELLTVRIFPDGTIERAKGELEIGADVPVETAVVDPAAVEMLLADLQAAGYFDLERTYLPEDTCCDRFLYLISAEGDEGVQTVEALEATEDTPETLWQSVALIEAVIDSAFSN